MIMLLVDNLVAHRGHRACFPENSMLAINDAIRLGATKIEIDVQLTRDGRLVLLHDENLQRISGVNVSIHDLMHNEISHYVASEPERFGTEFALNRINFFSELFPLVQLYDHIDFFMEVKPESIHYFGLEKTLQHIQRQLPKIPDNLIFISFHHEAVRLSKSIGFSRSALVFDDWDQRDHLLENSQADVGFINVKKINPTAAIIASAPIIVYESCDAKQILSLLERGAAAVETFCLGQFVLGD